MNTPQNERRIHRQNMTELLHRIYDDIMKDKIYPCAVWSERSYAQDDFSGFYCELDGFRKEIYSVMYNNLHTKLKTLCGQSGINIYFNHIVFELEYNDQKIYLGLNDNSISLSYQIGTMDGKRYEL